MKLDPREHGNGRKVFLIGMGLSVAAHAAALALVTLPVDTRAPDSRDEADHADRADTRWVRKDRPLRAVDLQIRSEASGAEGARNASGAPARAEPVQPGLASASGEAAPTRTVDVSARPVASPRTPPTLLATRTRLEERMDRAVQAFRQRMESDGARRDFGRDEPRVRIRGGVGGGVGGGPGCSSPGIAGGTDRGIGTFFPGR